jgi:hypothetical protein
MMRIFIILLAIGVLLVGCKESKPQFKIATLLSITETTMRKDVSVQDLASANDGKEKIKFRMLVKKQLLNTEAKRLAEKFINEMEHTANVQLPDRFWDYYTLEFEMLQADTGKKLFNGIKEKGNNEIYWVF